MDRYLEIFDVIYEIKDKISDQQYLFLNERVKELIDKYNGMLNYNYIDSSESSDGLYDLSDSSSLSDSSEYSEGLSGLF